MPPYYHPTYHSNVSSIEDSSSDEEDVSDVELIWMRLVSTVLILPCPSNSRASSHDVPFFRLPQLLQSL
jgi:hypothetical protein